MIEVSIVLPEHIESVWVLAAPFLEKAVEHGGGRYKLEDLHALVHEQRGQLWIAFDEQEVKGVAVTQFMQYPQLRSLLILSVGGKNMSAWFTPMNDLLIRWARENECKIIEAYGRIGWEKYGPPAGYARQFQVYQKEV